MNLALHPYLLARHEPERVAIEEDGRPISYGEFEALSRAMAHRLREAGLREGDVCALLTRDDAASLAAMFAVWRLGAVLLPLDRRARSSETDLVAARFQPRVVATFEPERNAGGRLSLSLEDGGSHGDRGDLPVVGGGDGTALLALSSGTTGEPKAAAITHDQHLARVLSYSVSYPIRREDRHISILPLAYNWGRNLAVSHLCLGATLILLPALSAPEELVAAAQDRRATSLAAVPHVSRALLQWAAGRPPVLGGLTRYFSSSAPLFAEERRQIRAHVAPCLTEVYGTTETGGLCVLPPEDQERAPGSVGRPAIGVEIEVVDEADRPVPRGETGSLRCRSPGTVRGYFGGSPADNERFRHGWYHPGDIGRIDGQGFVYLEGRSADVIKRRGMTIFAADIERALAAHPAVAEAAVVGLPTADRDEEIAAFVVLAMAVETAELETHCRIALSSHKLPQRITVLPALPRNAAGKVVKSSLAALAIPAAGMAEE